MSAKVTLVPAPGAPAAANAGMNGPIGPDPSRVSVAVGGSIESVRQEVDDAFKDMATFLNREPDEVMRMCGGHSARLAELRVRIQRVEDREAWWRSVRTREIEPALDQLRNQYEIASRLLTARELDWKMETGGR